MLRGGHEPGARVVRDTCLRPPLERGHQGLLRELLGETDVAHHPRQTGDETGRLDPPDRVYGMLRIGSRQGDRSQHVLPPAQGRKRYRRCVSIFLRSSSSFFMSFPLGSLGAKSGVSNTCRISTSVSSKGARLSHSIASSLDFTCQSQNPATSSLVSAKGPSITVRFPFSNLTRAPLEVGWSPSPASITPAFTSSSLNLPMSASIFSLGRTPASESLLAFTITMNRMSCLLGWQPGFRTISDR